MAWVGLAGADFDGDGLVDVMGAGAVGTVLVTPPGGDIARWSRSFSRHSMLNNKTTHKLSYPWRLINYNNNSSQIGYPLQVL